MLSTLFIWLLVYGLASVLGAGVVHLTHFRQSVTPAQIETVLIGLASLVAFLQAASILWPADYRLVLPLVLLAVLINWS